MKTAVFEPKKKDRESQWLIKLESIAFDKNICDIENNTVFSFQTSSSTIQFFIERPKKKLSSLRGRMTKQSDKEIDDQISNLRREWDRNI